MGAKKISPFHLFRDDLILFVVCWFLLVGVVCFCYCSCCLVIPVCHLVRCIICHLIHDCHNRHDARGNGAKKRLGLARTKFWNPSLKGLWWLLGLAGPATG